MSKIVVTFLLETSIAHLASDLTSLGDALSLKSIDSNVPMPPLPTTNNGDDQPANNQPAPAATNNDDDDNEQQLVPSLLPATA